MSRSYTSPPSASVACCGTALALDFLGCEGMDWYRIYYLYEYGDEHLCSLKAGYFLTNSELFKELQVPSS